MKILKIAFQNINSLKGIHEIDFTASPFTASSLFAITGPTGSGKSTILDVISLALFNQIPRIGKISRNEILTKGAILTRNQKEARAEITYECKNGIFSSHWSISTNRNQNLRDYEMHIFDLSTNKAFDLKKSDVPAKNEELIGLNYDQFIKSVLLAQGEFAQFLKARKDERGELLEKITGTGIYRQLGIMAFQKKREVTADIELQQQEIELHQKSLLQEQERTTFLERLSEKTKSSAPFELEVKKLEEHIRVKNEIHERSLELEKVLTRKRNSQAALEEFKNTHGIQLQKHEKIQLFGEELRHWKQLHTEIAALQKELLTVKDSKNRTQEELKTSLARINALLHKNVAEENIEVELHDFSVRVRNLQQKREAKRSAYTSLQREFDAVVKELSVKLNGDVVQAEQKLLELQKPINTDLARLKMELSEMDLKDPAYEKNRLKKQLEKARSADRQSEKIQGVSSELRKLREEKEKIQPFLESLPKELELTLSQAATLKEKLEKLQLQQENENLRKTLDQHRQQLSPGEPCPLCGALEHPFAENIPQQENGLKEEIKETGRSLSEKQQKSAATRSSLDHYRQRFDSLTQQESKKATELDLLQKDFKQEYEGLLTEESTNWQELVDKLSRQLTALEQYELENRKLSAITSGLPLLEDLKKTLEEGKLLNEELRQLYKGENVDEDCRNLQNQWTRLTHQKHSFHNQQKDLDGKLAAKKKQIQKLEEDLTPKIQEEGCTDIHDALSRLLPEQRASELRAKKELLDKEATSINSEEKTLELQLQKLRSKEARKSLEDINQELKDKSAQLIDLRKECEELRRVLKNDETTRKKIEDIESGLQEKKQKIRRWELLNQLIGDATGKKFNDFAQDLSLSHLLRLANMRLKDLSDRYSIDKPSAHEDDSLVAIDQHMGGQRRSVKTLSGGETFILSLSMALALSDLASKNVEIDSLFIDEGFGTLDPETLDQTLDILEKLQAESSKTIGIISHVDSLKERITTQVKLKRNGQGYSSLEVNG